MKTLIELMVEGQVKLAAQRQEKADRETTEKLFIAERAKKWWDALLTSIDAAFGLPREQMAAAYPPMPEGFGDRGCNNSCVVVLRFPKCAPIFYYASHQVVNVNDERAWNPSDEMPFRVREYGIIGGDGDCLVEPCGNGHDFDDPALAIAMAYEFEQTLPTLQAEADARNAKKGPLF